MPRIRAPLSQSVLLELPVRLASSADAFYYASLLSSVPFDLTIIKRAQMLDMKDAGIAGTSGPNCDCELHAPPMVMMAFAVELYLKLLKYMADGKYEEGHELDKLFRKMRRASPQAARIMIDEAAFSRGSARHFFSAIRDASSIFKDWRYAHEKDFLIALPTSLYELANASRCAIKTLYPDVKSNFDEPRHSDI